MFFAAAWRNRSHQAGFSAKPPWQELVSTGPGVHQASLSQVQAGSVFFTTHSNLMQRKLLRISSSEGAVSGAGT